MNKRAKTHVFALTLSEIGSKLKAQGMIEEAITISEIAAQLDPICGEIRVNLGHVYLDKGKIEEAIVEYMKALELDPKLEYAYDGLGDAYTRKGLRDEAIEYFRKAVESDPKSAVARRNLAGLIWIASVMMKQ
jgi:superkiller protein 3